MASGWISGKVVGRTDWTQQLVSLRIAADIAPFEAGQFAKFALEIDGDIVGRPYSLVNPPDDPVLEIVFSAIPGGPLSGLLADLRPHDTLLVSERANGFLTLSEVPAARNLWLLATGTGIGPFLSILRTEAPWERFERVILAHGVRQAADLCYRSLLSGIAFSRPSFSYIPLVSRESMEFALPGRIPAAIANGTLEERAGASLGPQDSHVMLCGNPHMLEDALAALGQRGMHRHRRRTPGHITMEAYW
ncbi:MAG: ferredoxin--NADP reductase [Zoogloea sp.]|nr:ferredoxin--NADP reductase [Zoogloea sp.]